MKQLISFVIPCYHSEVMLKDVVAEIVKTVENDGRYDCEVVLVNDNAPDATWRLIKELCENDSRVKGACMMHNFGQHGALMAGFNLVSGDIVVCLDDDGQTPPRECFKLIDALDDEVDAVCGDYLDNKFANGFRALGSNINDLMARVLLGKPKDLYLSSYVAMKRAVVDEIVRYKGPFPYVDGLMLRSINKIINVPVEHKDRAAGSSGYSLTKLIRLWMNGFTAFSVKPLRVSTLVGAIFTVIGFLIAIIAVIQKLVLGDAIDAGWTSIVCLMLVIGGLILAMLGMVGEYVGRMYMTMNSSPQFILRETINVSKK